MKELNKKEKYPNKWIDENDLWKKDPTVHPGYQREQNSIYIVQ